MPKLVPLIDISVPPFSGPLDGFTASISGRGQSSGETETDSAPIKAHVSAAGVKLHPYREIHFWKVYIFFFVLRKS